MSRHKNVRNLDADEHAPQDDYGSSYGSSYCDEVSLSTSVEKEYMYRRNTGMSPKLSHFYGRSNSVTSIPEEDNVGGRNKQDPSDSDDESANFSPRSGRRHSSTSCLLEALSDEDQTKLAQCLEQILDIVGESMPEIQVKETIVRCNFDTELSLNTLLNIPIGAYHESGIDVTEGRSGVSSFRGRNEPRGILDPQPTLWSPPATCEMGGAIRQEIRRGQAEVFLEETDSKLDDDSTNNLVTFNGQSNQCNDDAANDSDDNTKYAVNKIAHNNIFISPAPSAIPKQKGNRLKIRSRSPSPYTTPSKSTSQQMQSNLSNLNLTPNLNSSVSVATGSAIKMRKKEVVPKQIYDTERGVETDAKNLINLVVVGHVDSGKSTLMGHLLFDLGQVSSRMMHKYETESRKVGKGSFAYAWVLDETNEERERGITMDVGHSAFQTKSKNVTLLDAPGHRDFIPNMISGAYQADVAILVVNATRGEFEAGFDQGGQTREHALLVRSLGVSQLIVAVNKLDTVNWSKERFDEIIVKLGKFLKTQVGFKDSDLNYVPVSGLTGANLKEDNEDSGVKGTEDNRKLLFDWYQGPSLIQAIDNLRSPPRSIEKSFRMSISDIFKPTASGGGGFCVAGRIETGYIQKNDTVLIAPLNEYATVKNISLDNALPSASSLGLNCAFAGDHVSLTLVGSASSTLDPANLALGMIVCDPSQPVKVTKHFAAKLVVLNVETPITKGFACVLHHGGVTEAAVLKKLVAQLSKGTGEIVKKKPRILAKNSSAQVEVITDSPVCIETYAESKELGRFMLRSGGKTIAAGMITDIY